MAIEQQMNDVGYDRMASETIALLQKNDFPIQPACLRLRMCVSPSWMTTLLKKLEGWNPLIIGREFDFDTRLEKVYNENRVFNTIEDIVAKLDEALEPLTYLMEFQIEIQLDPGYYTKLTKIQLFPFIVVLHEIPLESCAVVEGCNFLLLAFIVFFSFILWSVWMRV